VNIVLCAVYVLGEGSNVGVNAGVGVGLRVSGWVHKLVRLCNNSNSSWFHALSQEAAPPPPPPPHPTDPDDTTCMICYNDEHLGTCVFLECGHGGECVYHLSQFII